MKRLHVAVGVIYRDGQVLIARRPDHLHKGGLWEFPGGKVETGESVTQALSRELHEELGIDIAASSPLLEISHDYPEKQVLLDVHLVTDFNGLPEGKEGQPLAWVSRQQLDDYAFPEANVAIIDAVKTLAV